MVNMHEFWTPEENEFGLYEPNQEEIDELNYQIEISEIWINPDELVSLGDLYARNGLDFYSKPNGGKVLVLG